MTSVQTLLVSCTLLLAVATSGFAQSPEAAGPPDANVPHANTPPATAPDADPPPVAVPGMQAPPVTSPAESQPVAIPEAEASATPGAASPGVMHGQPSTAPAPPVATYRRYGLMIVAADAIAVTAGMVSRDPRVFAAVYAAGGPLLHLLEGQNNQALWSIGLRVGLPLAGFYGGAALAPEQDELAAAVLGGVAGLTAAAVLDWVVFSRKPVDPAKGVAMMPSLSLTGDQVTASVIGRF